MTTEIQISRPARSRSLDCTQKLWLPCISAIRESLRDRKSVVIITVKRVIDIEVCEKRDKRT